MTNFDEPYDKMMKRIEESGYYSSEPEDKLKRLLPRGKRPVSRTTLKDLLTDEEIADLKEEYPHATD